MKYSAIIVPVVVIVAMVVVYRMPMIVESTFQYICSMSMFRKMNAEYVVISRSSGLSKSKKRIRTLSLTNA